jgi:ATP-dependent DNA helicase RecQ
MDDILRYKAYEILKDIYGQNAEFREGQYEAIEATMDNNRTLVVQKTGWGKSLVYFISTKLIRDTQEGITIVISPLLVLMDNQSYAAEKLGLECAVLNSQTEERDRVIEEIRNGEKDIIFITPESLFKDDIQNLIKSINIGLFVIDEAHCISEWGHDFRLDYGNLYKIINIIPSYVRILATTATANNQVVEDLKQQLGNNVYVSRGPLMRKSLSIQILKLSDRAERYAWILENINKLPGSGIIYCLTQRDCEYLADFLCKNGVNVKAYHSGLELDDTKNAEELFKNNKIKALVATVKLGMGYDKGDIAFVIHYQQPSGIVAYYQQIGRAGRNIPRAYTFLMYGKEDEDIHNYFINTAFPSEKEATEVYKCIFENSEIGISLNKIMNNVNINKGRCENTLKFLENEEYVYKEKSKYFPTANKFVYHKNEYNDIIQMRNNERRFMVELANTKECYSKFVVNKLDDPETKNCGICANCLGYEEFASKPSNTYIEKALDYIERLIMPIEPRKRWPDNSFTGKTVIEPLLKNGVCISKYGDPGYGYLVQKGKYSKPPYFSDELVIKSADVLKNIIADNDIKFITCVPSKNKTLVLNFAERLAKKCNLTFVELLEKSGESQQKENNNSHFQCRNAFESINIIENVSLPQKLIIVDDIVDSRWTLTVCGYKLMKAGCEEVIPFALADSSENKRYKNE